MVFNTQQKRVNYRTLELNNANIERLSQFNFLGVPYGKVTCFPRANNAWNTCGLHVCLNKNCTSFPHV